MPPREAKRSAARAIARELYCSGHSSKTALVSALGLSLPTVLQNVRMLMERGVVVQDGWMESSGGRKPESLSLNGDHAFALGVDITRGHVSLVGVDLRGELRWHERLPLRFSTGESYLQALQSAVDGFLSTHGLSEHNVLGAGLSLPGILSTDGHTLVDSHALGVSQYPLAALERCCRFRTLALNDANAAALAEKHLLPLDADLVYLSLSNSVGGAVFIDGQLYTGRSGRAGEFGHMPIVPDGRACYCGKRGCYDAYGSALLLSTPYHGQLETFFEALAQGDRPAEELWHPYRRHLALMCNHLRMAFDATVMLGGYVGAFLEPYLSQIRREAAQLNTFGEDGGYIRCCRYKTEAAAMGAALLHIERFLDTL